MSAGINSAIAARQKSNKYWEAKHPRAPKTGRKSESLLCDNSVRGWVKMPQIINGFRVEGGPKSTGFPAHG
jgi:hypothetical protein